MADAANESDFDRVERALPSVDRMAQRDGAELNESGGEYRFDHPHHSSPSTHGENASISSDGETWYCYRHRHGGSKLAWVGMSEGVISCNDLESGSIPRGLKRDVLEVAADRAGVELSDAPAVSDEVRERRDHFDAHRRVVAQYYHRKLDEHDMRAELQRRYGFSDELINERLIGYAPPEGMEHDLPGETGLDPNDLMAIGALNAGKSPHWRDRFIFPYWELDRNDMRVRYFIGRDVPGDSFAKYTKIAKHDHVHDSAKREPPFGIHTIRGARQVVVTEGVTDALSLHDHGIAAVAPVTTHISGDALDAFARALRGKEVYVVRDEDAGTNAGIEGAARDAWALYDNTPSIPCTVCRLPHRPNESTDVNEWLLDQEGGLEETAEAFRDEVLGGMQYPAPVAWWAWGKGRPHHVFSAAIEGLGHNPSRAVEMQGEDGEPKTLSVTQLVGEHVTDLAEARRRFYNSGKTVWSAGTHKEAYHNVMRYVLHAHGEFFKSETGTVHYYHKPEGRSVTVGSTAGRSNAHAEFLKLVEDVFGITTAKWGRDLIEGVARHLILEAPERPTARLSYYDDERGELYLNRYDGHYYALDGHGIDLRRNGTDVFFIDVPDGEPYRYLPADDRDAVPTHIPGERPWFAGAGDMVHRVLANRINYDEEANLGPDLQRAQLYIHLHALAFTNAFDGKPIMAWVGQKGSGKTVGLRSIGKFLYGPSFSVSTMADDQDDFVTKATNRTLLAIDNYDDGVSWANDMLAAVATGASVEKRELYTTNDLARFEPECFLALTSRNPPFRRDDVADRCLVFRVARVEDEFIAESEYLKQPIVWRDELWSDYLDNLNEILRVRHDRDEHRDTTHRMADWALFAQDCGEALGVEHVDELLGGMQTERAFFSLENEPIRIIIEEWLDEPASGGTHTASDLVTEWKEVADLAGVNFPYSSARGLSTALTSLSDELGQLFGMEVDAPRSGPKEYTFPGGTAQYLQDSLPTDDESDKP